MPVLLDWKEIEIDQLEKKKECDEKLTRLISPVKRRSKQRKWEKWNEVEGEVREEEKEDYAVTIAQSKSSS